MRGVGTGRAAANDSIVYDLKANVASILPCNVPSIWGVAVIGMSGHSYLWGHSNCCGNQSVVHGDTMYTCYTSCGTVVHGTA